jgi:hypothetical protein
MGKFGKTRNGESGKEGCRETKIFGGETCPRRLIFMDKVCREHGV